MTCGTPLYDGIKVSYDKPLYHLLRRMEHRKEPFDRYESLSETIVFSYDIEEHVQLKVDFERIVKKVLSLHKPRWRKIFCAYYFSRGRKTFTDVGKEFDLSRSRVSQIMREMLDSIRGHIQKRNERIQAHTVIVPAHDEYYGTGEAVFEAFMLDKAFKICNIFDSQDGKIVNMNFLRGERIYTVEIRYRNRTRRVFACLETRNWQTRYFLKEGKK